MRGIHTWMPLVLVERDGTRSRTRIIATVTVLTGRATGTLVIRRVVGKSPASLQLRSLQAREQFVAVQEVESSSHNFFLRQHLPPETGRYLVLCFAEKLCFFLQESISSAYNASMQNTREGMPYIGCPVWSHKEWVGTFFPEHTPPGDFLRLYSHKLSTVEGNTTFYAVPSIETIARWRAETPQGFRFCPKIPRQISHTPALQATRDATLAFIRRMRGLGERLGPIFLQLPPAFGPSHLTQLESWLGFWPPEVRLAVE